MFILVTFLLLTSKIQINFEFLFYDNSLPLLYFFKKFKNKMNDIENEMK